MIRPKSVQMSWGGTHDLEAVDLPDWTRGQELTWSITAGQGSIQVLEAHKIRFTGPPAGPRAADQTLIHVYSGSEVVGECTIFLAALMAERIAERAQGLPPEPEPEPPPTEEEIIPPLDCCADPKNPDQPLNIIPEKIQLEPFQRVSIRIPFIYKDCDQSCYTWKISKGGGVLDCACGARAIYRAPRYNENCEDNAVVDLICLKKVVAQCHIAINTHWSTEHAYAEYDQKPTWTYTGTDRGERGDPPIPCPSGGQGSYLHLRYYVYIYNCMGELIIKRPYHSFDFWWGWSIYGNKWVLQDMTPLDFFGSYDSQGDIPISKLRIRSDEDLRSAYMKKRGCCPLVIYEKMILEM